MAHPGIKVLTDEIAKTTKLRDDATTHAEHARASARAWEEAVPRHQKHIDELAEALIVLKKAL
jgi:hypothetical protein